MSGFRQYLRIRPIDYVSEMINIEDNKITVKDTSFKMNQQNMALSGMQADDQSFKVGKILDQSTQQEDLFREIGIPSIEKVLSGLNSLMICYGQTGSGKTYSIFGQHPEYLIDSHNTLSDPFARDQRDLRGLVPRSIEYLLEKIVELQDSKEIVIAMSFAEIYQDRIRDLGALYLQQDGGKKTLNYDKVIKQMENENLTLYENTNGQIVVKDMAMIGLESMEQLYGILRCCFQLRDQMELKGVSIWERAHTIFTVNLIQKDKENENIPFSNCFLQFVDLAGSERIAKSLTEGHKYQESIIINQNLTSLAKCLQAISLKAKSVPYKESKISRLLQNSMQARSMISLIGTINPSESNYEECVASLQFIERCSKDAPKMLPIAGSQNAGLNVSTLGGNQTAAAANNSKIIEKLQRDNAQMKEKMDKQSADQKKRLHDIQMLLGIDVELDKLFLKSSLKELNQLKQQKDALVRLDNVQRQNQELETTISNLQKHIEEIKKVGQKKLEQQNCLIIELNESLKNIREQMNQKDMNSKSDLKLFQKDKEQEIRQLIERSNAVLEEKTNLVFNLPQFVTNKTQDNQKLNDLKKATKYEAEKEHKVVVETLKKEYQQLLENSKTQFEFYLKQKNEQIDQYVADSKKYREHKKTQIDEMKVEMADMYDVMTKLNNIIQKVEMGHYSGGIKSVNIHEKEKPSMPVRQKFKHLFKVLDLKLLGQSSLKTGEFTRKSQENLRKSTGFAPTTTAAAGGGGGVNSSDPYESVMKVEELPQVKASDQPNAAAKENEANRIDVNINLNQFKNKEDFLTIKNFAERLKQSLAKSMLREKELQQRVDEFQKINNNIDITAVVKERDQFKNLYQQELRKYNQARIVLESQKRLLNSPKFNAALLAIPQTVSHMVRPGTASMQGSKSLLKLPINISNNASQMTKSKQQ